MNASESNDSSLTLQASLQDGPNYASSARIKKADKTFVQGDEVISKLRGTTPVEPAQRASLDEVRGISA